MNINISQTLKRAIKQNSAHLDVSESEYMRNALVHYNQLLELDTQLQEELGLWEKASTEDSRRTAQKYRL